MNTHAKTFTATWRHIASYAYARRQATKQQLRMALSWAKAHAPYEVEALEAELMRRA